MWLSCTAGTQDCKLYLCAVLTGKHFRASLFCASLSPSETQRAEFFSTLVCWDSLDEQQGVLMLAWHVLVSDMWRISNKYPWGALVALFRKRKSCSGFPEAGTHTRASLGVSGPCVYMFTTKFPRKGIHHLLAYTGPDGLCSVSVEKNRQWPTAFAQFPH